MAPPPLWPEELDHIPGETHPYSPGRLVTHAIDEKAQRTPDAECFRSPRSSDPDDGWEVITCKKFADSINATALWLMDVLGVPERDTFPTIGYLGSNDARYLLLALGGTKAGYKFLFNSPRNTIEGHLSLFEKTKCDVLFLSATMRTTARPLLEGRPSMKAIEVAPLADWWVPEGKTVPHVPHNKTYDEAKSDPFIVLHTSGSTGIPKPVVSPHGMIATSDRMHDLPPHENMQFYLREMKDRIRKGLMHPMPLFHAAGIFCGLINIAYWDIPTALWMPDRPLTGDLVAKCVTKAGCDAVTLPAATIVEMTEDEEQLKFLSGLSMLKFAGGPLPAETGHKLVDNGTFVASIIASTECVPYPMYFNTNPRLWQYYIFKPEKLGVEFRRVGSEGEEGMDDVYQMIIHRREPHGDPGYQGWFWTFPELQEYDTKDLFRAHPTLPHHWRYYGRSDDVVVFSNGEKLNPVTIEQTLMSIPTVKGAIIVGAGNFQPALFIEPFDEFDRAGGSTAAAEAFIDELWPLVQQANEATVAHGRIARHMIRLSDPAKPFPRAGKGTIQRAGTVKLYADEIAQVYAEAEKLSATTTTTTAAAAADGADNTVATAVDASSEAALTQSIREIFQESISATASGQGGATIGPDTDLFSSGVDSLMVINASRQLRIGLQQSAATATNPGVDLVTARAIYANPTPRKLARHILAVLGPAPAAGSPGRGSSSSSGSVGAESAGGGGISTGSTAGTDLSSSSSSSSPPLPRRDGGLLDDEDDQQETINTLQALLDRFTADLPKALHADRPDPAETNQTVVLTGSTGTLGGYILSELLANPRVGKVICLNRAADGGASKFRQKQQQQQQGATVEFHHVDTSQPNLGLPPTVYARLLRETDRVIHNAWPVNFNIPISSFASSLQGVRNIADFASQAEKRVVVVFVSSISSVKGYTGPAGGAASGKEEGDEWLIPERLIDDFRVAIPGGAYGQSKMLGSLILDAASKQSGFVAASVRVGQIAGSERAAAATSVDDNNDGAVVVWNRHEWLPSLIASSVHLGALPRTLGLMNRVDWTPIERIAGLLVEVAGVGLARSQQDGGHNNNPVTSVDQLGGYYHGVNPQATTWDQGGLVETVQEFYQIPKIVNVKEWVGLLEQSQREMDQVADPKVVASKLELNPGVKLLDTYRDWANTTDAGKGSKEYVLDMTKTKQRSESMRTAGGITAELLKGWCRQWDFKRD